MGNIPPKQELTFISNFIQFAESSKNYEFELFRNLPIFVGGNSICISGLIEGQIEIKTINNISKIEKILSKEIKITEEKYLYEERKNNYLIKYLYINQIIYQHHI